MSRTVGPLRALLLSGALVALAVACARWPLTIWSFTLAAFGIPHALVELRWVGSRYGRWRTVVPPVIAVLALIGVARLLAFQCGWTTAQLATLEVALGVVLVATILPRDAGRCVVRSTAATLVLAALGCGVAIAPVDTLLVLAVVHNLTPLGLLADRLRDPDRDPARNRWWIAGALIGFAMLPGWLMTGGAASWLGLENASSTSAETAAASWLGLVITDGLRAFAPSWFPTARALDLLRAAAFLQCLHYVAVLLVMPRLGPAPRTGARAFARPDRPFLILAAGLGALFFAGFVSDFREAKAAYGIVAAVHVWAEFPALLLALTPRSMPSPTS